MEAIYHPRPVRTRERIWSLEPREGSLPWNRDGHLTGFVVRNAASVIMVRGTGGGGDTYLTDFILPAFLAPTVINPLFKSN